MGDVSEVDRRRPPFPPARDHPDPAPCQYDENGVDLSLIRANMRLTPLQRARRAEQQRKAALRVQQIGRDARSKPP